jgi:hypothetical protein
MALLKNKFGTYLKDVVTLGWRAGYYSIHPLDIKLFHPLLVDRDKGNKT